jgi:hypothetical protein
MTLAGEMLQVGWVDSMELRKGLGTGHAMTEEKQVVLVLLVVERCIIGTSSLFEGRHV